MDVKCAMAVFSDKTESLAGMVLRKNKWTEVCDKENEGSQ